MFGPCAAAGAGPLATGRPPGPALPWPLPLLALLPLLLAVISAPVARSAPAVHLHAARSPISSETLVYHTAPGRPSIGSSRSMDNLLLLFQQQDALDAVPEVRWGSFMPTDFTSRVTRLRSAPPSPKPIMHLPVVDNSGEMAFIEHTDRWVGLFAGDFDYALPGPSTELLAGVGVSTVSADLLGIYQPLNGPWRVYMATLSAGGLTGLSHSLPELPSRPHVSPGIGRAFYLASEHRLFHLLVGGNHVAQFDLSISASVRRMAVSRILSRETVCPSAADVVLLLDSHRVMILPCHPDPGFQESMLVADLPAGATADGDFITPPAPAMTEAFPFLHYLDSNGALWRADVAPLTGITWRRVLLSGVSLFSDLQLLRLKTTASGPGAWTLVRHHVALFDSEAFGCHTDPSIICDADGVVTGSPVGWTCALDRTESPFALPGQLCAGCPDGFFLDRPADEPAFSSPSHGCRPCWQYSCRTCNQDHCLACFHPLLLEPSGPGGATICVASCSENYAPLAGVCQRVDIARADLSMRSPLPDSPGDLPAGRIITGAGETCLSSGGASTLPIITSPALPCPRNILLFSGSQESWIMANADIGKPDKAPPRPVDILSRGIRGPVIALAEVGPFLQADGTLVLGLVLCGGEAGELFEAWLSCPGSGLCMASSLASPQSLGVVACVGVQRLGPQAIVAYSSALGVVIHLQADLTSLRFKSFSMKGVGLVGLPSVRANRSLPASRDPDPWLVVGTPGSNTVAGPLALPARDSRWRGLSQGFITRDFLDSEALYAPVYLPRGSLGFGSELFFARTSGQRLEVVRVPGDMLPSGRTIRLATSLQVLGDYPSVVGGGLGFQREIHFQALCLDGWSMPEYPSALLLLTRKFFGLSLLRCRSASEPCFLLPARFARLSPGLELQPDEDFWMPFIARVLEPPEPAREGTALTLWTHGRSIGGVVTGLEFSCSSGHYGLDCRPCHPSCRQCNGPGAADCTVCMHWLPGAPQECIATCPPGSSPGPLPQDPCQCHSSCSQCDISAHAPVRCIDCRPGFVLPPDEPAPAVCLPCAHPCLRCTLPEHPTACTACMPGNYFHQGQCLLACPDGFWPDHLELKCAACSAACASCSSSDFCIVCKPGWFRRSDGQCIRCDASCASCHGLDSCLTCQPGLVFLQTAEQVDSLCGRTCPPGELPGASRCVKCDDSCGLCAVGPSQCVACAEGHRWASGPPRPGGTGSCVPCHPGCASCTSGSCHACGGGLLLTRQGDCVAVCPAGTYGTDESCQPCDVSCATCVGGQADQCASCAAGLALAEVADGVGSCRSTCPTGEYHDVPSGSCMPCDAACATCNGPSDRDCWRCASGVLQDGDCVQHCAAKHVALAGRCLPCHVSCDQCAGTRSTECLPACPSELLALPAGASPMRCVPACPVGYSASGAGCTPCGEHCASCPGRPDACALCDRGWLLDAPLCVASCPVQTTPLGGQCMVCDETCDACFGPGPEDCVTCGRRFPLLFDGRCLATCPPGTFQDGKACLPCNGSCAGCNGPEPVHCTACPGGLVLHVGVCTSACPDGFFPEGGLCVRCEPTCATCDNPDTCASCGAGRFLSPAGLCVDSCPAGAHACAASGRCLACPAHCAECTSSGASCMPACTGCEEGFFLSDDQCVASCPAGTYSPPELGACAACAASCPTCVERADRCTSCASGVLAGQRPGADALPVAVQDLVRAAWQADPAMRPHAAILRQQCAALFVTAGGLGISL
ncbi:hypothetical protein H696_03230 [Fonticula alba]|uniref:EGF-like domain-containing protein n=1 Tax=Fonticula alba TaxID=691883 RepID=A0A058Z688_FONAL|nr:hypothetical protein H696_03230 [Fonticula alba]KCV69785.1 hypothetical protein H696_03230 [Fonticula alba]|eukprot:XP_009495391.1 hypothetical protein H696_03230 [Fonticula alba]